MTIARKQRTNLRHINLCISRLQVIEEDASNPSVLISGGNVEVVITPSLVARVQLSVMLVTCRFPVSVKAACIFFKQVDWRQITTPTIP